MRLRHIFIAATAFVSMGALAEGNRASTDKQAQASPAAQSQATSSAVIKQAQQKLSAAGHDAGPADGTMSAKTVQALKDFQKAKGIDTTGQLDQRTLAALGVRSTGVGATSGAAPEARVGSSPSQQRSGEAGAAKGY
jgi:peptidoglycan hydrolase-like protein with peptidoglycan-binding domain